MVKINESNLKFNSLDNSNKPSAIILHHAEAKTCSIYDIHNWHLSNGWSGCGYHFLVRKDGSVWRGRPETAMGAHTLGCNDSSIGICAEGAYNTESMPEAQKKAIIELGIYLKDKYSITKVYGHKNLNSTDCPGRNYPLEEIKKSILEKQKLYRVQVGAFRNKEYADNLVRELKLKGYKDAFVKEE